MRATRLLLAALFCLAPLGRAAAQAAPDTRPGIAVFPFTNGGSYGPNHQDLTPLEVGMQQMLLTELAQNNALRIVERSSLKALLDEQNLVEAGRVDPSTAAKIGKLVGARYVVTGSFVDLYGNFRLDGRVVDVQTGEVLRTAQVQAKDDKMYDLIVQLSGKITDGLDLPPLDPAVRQARAERQIPPEAITLYSRAQVYQDGGQKERAIELYRRIAHDFPQMTEAREALQQLTQS
ncbi:MAG TPA: CsgG/HfaB family protein [Longimicrobiaceae bacterium]|nr:CsgG/HfaB family protein [Longimicrobiaceae bacterium]